MVGRNDGTSSILFGDRTKEKREKPLAYILYIEYMMDMPKAQINLFSSQHIALAQFARALSHPARVAIVTHLLEHGRQCCGEIVKAMPLAQPSVSRHLRELEEAGLVRGEPCGVKVCYTLRKEHIQHFCSAFHSTLGQGAEEADHSPPREESAGV